MRLYFFIGALAALGALCALWAMLGKWLGGRANFVAICFCRDAYSAFSALARWRWLRGMGLIRGRLLLIDCGINEEEKQVLSSRGVDFVCCRPSELAEILELERKELD